MSLEHYERLLAPIYAWMVGNWDQAVAQAQADLKRWQVKRLLPGLAVDLGCGPGVYSLALAHSGFEVLALDNCESLLNELREKARSLPIVCQNADLVSLPQLAWQPRLIVCLGDTLTHLPDWESIERVVEWCADSLPVAGCFMVSFRNYHSEREGAQKFIPVRADIDRILTCHLLYESEHVAVTDLVYQRLENQWEFSSSQYRKIRIDPSRMAKTLKNRGFAVSAISTERGWEEFQAVRLA